MNIENSYIDIYKNYKNVLFANSPEVLNAKREDAYNAFVKLGFPAGGENYKRTNAQACYAVDYGMNLNRFSIKEDPSKTFHCGVQGINSYIYYVVNDVYFGATENNLPEGVIIGSLNQVARQYPDLIAKYYGKTIDVNQDGNWAFNQMFAQDGLFLYVPKNVHIDRPIQLVNIMTSQKPLMAISHNLIIVEENAKAQILVCDHTDQNIQFLSNRVTEVFVAENAIYEHYKVENTYEKMTNFSTLNIQQQSSSSVLSNIITLNNGITRNNVNINIDGEHAETILAGLVIGDKEQKIDNQTFINHIKPNSKSNETFKYILDDSSVGAFSGLILVNKDAQKTVSKQSNRNICLTDKARMYSKPQLEIYADDVKCGHGSTMGQLDDTAMFYLRSRGISQKEAQLLLMSAFVSDVIDNIKVDALKDRVRMLVEMRLRRELSVCSSCSVCK